MANMAMTNRNRIVRLLWLGNLAIDRYPKPRPEAHSSRSGIVLRRRSVLPREILSRVPRGTKTLAITFDAR